VLFGVGTKFVQDGKTSILGVFRVYLLLFASIDCASQVSFRLVSLLLLGIISLQGIARISVIHQAQAAAWTIFQIINRQSKCDSFSETGLAAGHARFR
jgi:hypothetical protein